MRLSSLTKLREYFTMFAEFLRRLALSIVFDDVVLVRTGTPRSGGASGLVAFELTCKVRY